MVCGQINLSRVVDFFASYGHHFYKKPSCKSLERSHVLPTFCVVSNFESTNLNYFILSLSVNSDSCKMSLHSNQVISSPNYRRVIAHLMRAALHPGPSAWRASSLSLMSCPDPAEVNDIPLMTSLAARRCTACLSSAPFPLPFPPL